MSSTRCGARSDGTGEASSQTKNPYLFETKKSEESSDTFHAFKLLQSQISCSHHLGQKNLHEIGQRASFLLCQNCRVQQCMNDLGLDCQYQPCMCSVFKPCDIAFMSPPMSKIF